MHTEELLAVVVLPLLWAAIGFIVWVFLDNRRRVLTVKARAEFHNRLMDKVGSARELTEFAQTEGGRRFLDTFSSERIGPIDRILGSLQKGAILGIVGLGCLFLGWKYGREVFTIIGTLAVSLGAGFLVSSAISYKLSKGWGLFSSLESGRVG
jgi:hypothetical protein